MEKLDIIFTDSWKLLRHNLILFVPNLLMFLFSIILVLIYLKVIGVFNVFGEMLSLEIGSIVLAQFWIANKQKIIFFSAIYGILIFLVDTYFTTVKYGMIKDVVLDGEASLRKGMRFGWEKFFTVFTIRLISFLIIFGPIIGIIIASILLIPKIPALMTFVLLFAIAGIAYIILIWMRLLFVYPTMAFEHEGSLTSIKHDFHYAKTHMGHTIIVWLVILAVGIGAFAIKASLISFGKGIIGVVLISAILLLIETTMSVWEHIFLFENYYKER